MTTPPPRYPDAERRRLLIASVEYARLRTRIELEGEDCRDDLDRAAVELDEAAHEFCAALDARAAAITDGD